MTCAHICIWSQKVINGMQPMISCFYTLLELCFFINIISYFQSACLQPPEMESGKDADDRSKKILLMMTLLLLLSAKLAQKFGSIEHFGFSRIIPGMPVFSSSLNQCSNCMDQDKFLVLTSNCDASE